MARKRKLSEIVSLFEMMPEEWKTLHRGLLENAVFMDEQLAQLREAIKKNGLTSYWQNGENQGGARKAPEVDIYNTMVKNYAQIIKQLNEQLPEQKSDDLAEFLK